MDGGGHADDALASGDAAAPFRRLFGAAGGFFVVFAGVVFGDFDGGGEWDLTRVRVVVVPPGARPTRRLLEAVGKKNHAERASPNPLTVNKP